MTKATLANTVGRGTVGGGEGASEASLTRKELLFNEKVNGQLHNALVDIAVTLRVYMKLIHDIDICG